MTVSYSIGAVLIAAQLAIAAPDTANSRLLTSPQFEEPLVATTPTSPKEDSALVQAIDAYRDQSIPDDFRAFDAFLSAYPHSGWRMALLTNLGLSFYHYGYFSKAIDSWERAWHAGRAVSETRAKALVDRAVGELARMHARLGHADRLESLLQEIGGRPVTGPATEALQGAREGLWLMRNEPGQAYLCGPMALRNLLLSQGVPFDQIQFLSQVRSGPRGVSLAEVAQLAAQAGIPYRLVFRESGQPVPVPSIVHWKVTHFAAIVEEADGRFHLQDPTFGQDLWVTRAAVESESSGYFLVPASQSLAGLRQVDDAEASQVRGMGNTGSSQQGAVKPDDLTARLKAAGCGMCGYNFHEMAVSLNLNDTPVGYAPPRGPAVYVTLTYNQREADQPANFSWFNVSPKWTLNWLTYIQDDPVNARANALRYVAGGGSVTYTGFNLTTNSFTRETADASLLVRTSANPIAYERRLADGGREIYSLSNGAATNPRRVFLTQVVDAAGNAVTLKYDNQLRLTSITDAVGRVTTFIYSIASRPLLLTRITDPFFRNALIDYDANGRLIRIVDVLGLASQFTYDAASLVDSMTTPYGTTKFAYGQTGAALSSAGAFRFIEATDPLGFKERLEFRHLATGIAGRDSVIPKGMPTIQNDYLYYRNTFYWDKHAYPLAFVGTAPSYTKARIKHWTHLVTNQSVTADTLESVKDPFENRVWFTYPGQNNALFSGTLDKVSAIGRVMDDNTTQLAVMAYNTLGRPTRKVDAAGRETQLEYDTSNLIDMLRVKQKTSATVFSTIAEFTYNSQHLPLTLKDASGQTTSFLYNSFGQPTQVTDALGRVTSFEYDSLGYLTRVVNPNGQTAAAFTYDTFGRIATRTDSEGRFVSFSYDALDRVTKQTFADGSTREFTWDKLDMVAAKDRQGRVTRYTYDAVRNLVEVNDPIGRKTKLTYYENGRLKSLTDPNGKTTTWDIDLQNRVTAKHYPDGTVASNTYENTTSRLRTFTDAKGQKKQYTYTPDDQIAAVEYGNATSVTPSVRFTYDPYYRRIASMVDGSGTTQYQYQPLGSLGALSMAKEDGPYQNDTIVYQYDALGRLAARTVDTASEDFTYDGLGRIATHGSPLASFDLGYLGETGQLASRRVRGGTLGTEWTYDVNANDRRLTSISTGGARSFQYGITPENVIGRIVENAAADGGGLLSQTWDYTHDESDRLLQSVSSSGAQYAYRYDPAGNIMAQQKPDGERSASYDAVNQLTNFNGQSIVYDANGNVTDDGERLYQWDAENRLIGVALKSQPDKKTIFRYDGLGRRTAIVSPEGVETRYLWCGEAICQARDSQDVVSRRYYPEGELIPGGGRLYYATDHLGSIRDLTSAEDGSRLASFDYDPYGNPTQTDGAVTSDFRYAGMFYHAGSGLYLTQYRAYDPRTGRWLSRDPMGESGGTNLYSYVDANPIAKVDPKGQMGVLSTFGPPRGPTWGGAAKQFYDLITQLTYIHYMRNDLNVNVPLLYAQDHWRELPPEKSVFHRMGGATGNRKFVSPSGKCEVVYKPNGEIETDPLNLGTYNFYDPESDPMKHFFADILPYMVLGNSPEDMFTWDRWQAAVNSGWNSVTTPLGATFDWLFGVNWEL